MFVKKAATMTVSLLVIGLAIFAVCPASGQIIMNNLPPMTGVASPPVKAKITTLVIYSISQTDADTWSPSGQLFDTTCAIHCVALRSMTGMYPPTSRGVSGFTQIWDIVGFAKDVPGYYVDEWLLVNERGNTDEAKDEPFAVAQVVILEPPVGNPPGGGGGN